MTTYTYNPIQYPTSISGTSYTVASGATTSSVAWATIADGTDLKPATLQVKGNAEFDGEVKIQGKSIKDALESIEARLAILHPNEELEEKWEQLKGLRQMYIELEAEIIEKEKMWSILKK